MGTLLGDGRPLSPLPALTDEPLSRYVIGSSHAVLFANRDWAPSRRGTRRRGACLVLLAGPRRSLPVRRRLAGRVGSKYGILS